jgi:4-oxalocrotonate tautomerase
MPLVRITLATGRTAAERKAIADGVHNALVQTANVPADDRFQIVQEVPKSGLVWDAGYLGFSRTAGIVFVEITLNAGRTVEVKKALYARVAEHLGAAGVPPGNVLVNLVEVARENWSFGDGRMSYPPVP